MIQPKKDDEFIKALLKQPEGETLDFKQGISSTIKIAKTIIAFANTRGGKIVIGISDNKKIVGIDEAEEIFMIEKAISDYCFPPVQVLFEVYEIKYFDDEEFEKERYVLIVEILKSKVRHMLKNGEGKIISYKREKDRTLPDLEA
jgi:predicted HTH transcriptional regulator